MPHPTDTATPPLTRRERQREETYADIVRAARELLTEGAELSLRAVAGRMGMTAPGLYRYVASYQELVDLVAFEIDRTATETFAAAADRFPEDDSVGRLVAAVTEFRMWALANPREFATVFANPVADSSCVRRDLLTLASSGLLMTGLIHRIYRERGFAIPALADLPESVHESLLDPLIPAPHEDLTDDERGLLWVDMQGWTALYGVVTLEVMGHMDPRVIESGEMFLDTLRRFAPVIGLDDEVDRLLDVARERITRG